jgi:hypothetical protein
MLGCETIFQDVNESYGSLYWIKRNSIPSILIQSRHRLCCPVAVVTAAFSFYRKPTKKKKKGLKKQNLWTRNSNPPPRKIPTSGRRFMLITCLNSLAERREFRMTSRPQPQPQPQLIHEQAAGSTENLYALRNTVLPPDNPVIWSVGYAGLIWRFSIGCCWIFFGWKCLDSSRPHRVHLPFLTILFYADAVSLKRVPWLTQRLDGPLFIITGYPFTW